MQIKNFSKNLSQFLLDKSTIRKKSSEKTYIVTKLLETLEYALQCIQLM